MDKDNGNNGKGDFNVNEALDWVHTPKTIENALKTTDQDNVIKFLMIPDDDIMNNLMKLDIPSYRAALAVSALYPKCEQYKNEKGKRFIKMLLLTTTAVKAKRANMSVDAVIGERRWKQGGGGGGENVIDKIKGWVSGQ